MSSKASYHHGELRAALIEAALIALEDGGMRALSLRSLARSVGVSPMAPYHHFADRTDLMVAIAVEGFKRLQTSKESALSQAGADPAKGLVAGTLNYVEFMIANPNLHRLMHDTQSAEGAIRHELTEAAAAPAASLLKLVQQLLSTHSSAYSAQMAATSIWSLAHGIGTLALSGQIGSAEAKTVARAGAEALIRGWLAD
jgi:AcrR family transcriptional regulator